jgi:hypothetical protein
MKITGADEALEHIASWAARGRWKEQCQRVLNDHFEPVCTRAGIDEGELARLLGDHHYRIIQGCAFEDFLSRLLGPKGATSSTTTSISGLGRNRWRGVTICARYAPQC